jgi:urease alpha subunit
MTYDLLIKNARVVDGSGEPSFQADVAVHQGKIVGVGKITATATRTIDAEGRVVARDLSITTRISIRRRCGIHIVAHRCRTGTPRSWSANVVR